jgi:hypothetical protein
VECERNCLASALRNKKGQRWAAPSAWKTFCRRTLLRLPLPPLKNRRRWPTNGLELIETPELKAAWQGGRDFQMVIGHLDLKSLHRNTPLPALCGVNAEQTPKSTFAQESTLFCKFWQLCHFSQTASAISLVRFVSEPDPPPGVSTIQVVDVGSAFHLAFLQQQFLAKTRSGRSISERLYMCLRMKSPAMSRVGNGGWPGPKRHTAPKRRPRNGHSIACESRSSGWRRLMISSNGGANKSS